mmetsp:Transcript_29902/g.66163  ORF Transcript_29902/g.66163 Transcript_29902/m.66163 type:complete len:228 (+) Transcript_29902:229-912(+)
MTRWRDVPHLTSRAGGGRSPRGIGRASSSTSHPRAACSSMSSLPCPAWMSPWRACPPPCTQGSWPAWWSGCATWAPCPCATCSSCSHTPTWQQQRVQRTWAAPPWTCSETPLSRWCCPACLVAPLCSAACSSTACGRAWSCSQVPAWTGRCGCTPAPRGPAASRVCGTASRGPPPPACAFVACAPATRCTCPPCSASAPPSRPPRGTCRPTASAWSCRPQRRESPSR